jgi:GNAT superfamily N-acetyltransferase
LSKNVPNQIYYDGQHRLIEKLILRSKTYVACDVNDPNQLYGYGVAEVVDGIFVVHFIYVKLSFRRMGIGTALLNSFEYQPGSLSAFTHWTKMAERLHIKYNMVYHPYILMVDYSTPKREELDYYNVGNKAKSD